MAFHPLESAAVGDAVEVREDFFMLPHQPFWAEARREFGELHDVREQQPLLRGSLSAMTSVKVLRP